MQRKSENDSALTLDDLQKLRMATEEPVDEPNPPTGKRPWLVLSMLLVGVILAALDLTVVVSILTTMMYDLDIPINDLDKGAWIVTAYLLAYTVTMPFLGRVSDVYGRRPVFLIALLVFVAGSVMVAVSTKELGLGWVIGGRVVQAIGGGAMVPVSMAVVGDIFPGKQRGMALGLIGAADTAGWVIGPLYGSLMLKGFGWHSIFWINLPLGLVSAALIFVALRSVPNQAINNRLNTASLPTTSSSKFGQLDVVGFILIALALTGLNLAFGGGKEVSALGGSAFQDLEKNPLKEYQLPILVGAGIALLLFIIVELFVAKRPLLNLRTFRRPAFSAANLTNLLIGGGLIVALVGVALFVNTTHQSNDRIAIAFDSALALAPLTLGMAIGAIIGGWLSDRVGYRIGTVLGLTLAVFGFIVMAKWQVTWQPPADLPLLFPGAGLTGLGFGIVIAPVGAAVIDWADREDMGVSAALVLILRLVGMTVGLAILLQWGLGRFRDLTADLSPLNPNAAVLLKSSLAQVITEMFIASAVLTALAFIPAVFLNKRPDNALSEEEKRRRHELSRLL